MNAQSIEDGNIPTNVFLKELVIERNLFVSGHFRLNSIKSARDWINLEQLFSLRKEDFIEPITKVVYREILEPHKKSEKENPLSLIGLNYYGAILASVMGYKYKIPFSYYFDDISSVDSIENELQDINSTHLVIITDAMVYGKKICKFVDTLCNSNAINKDMSIDVLALFERKINQDYISSVYLHSEVDHVYILNDNFDIEICNKDKEKCLFIKNEDMCKNKNARF